MLCTDGSGEPVPSQSSNRFCPYGNIRNILPISKFDPKRLEGAMISETITEQDLKSAIPDLTGTMRLKGLELSLIHI